MFRREKIWKFVELFATSFCDLAQSKLQLRANFNIKKLLLNIMSRRNCPVKIYSVIQHSVPATRNRFPKATDHVKAGSSLIKNAITAVKKSSITFICWKRFVVKRRFLCEGPDFKLSRCFCAAESSFRDITFTTIP